MKKFLIFAAAIILLAAAIPMIFFDGKNNMDRSGIIEVNGQKFKVELADSPEIKAKGLGGREKLCPDCGMVFLFDRPGKHAFWMKDMKFPLDIIWVKDERIVFLAKNVPADYKNIISPLTEANMVLEISAGLVDKYGIHEGDMIVLN